MNVRRSSHDRRWDCPSVALHGYQEPTTESATAPLPSMRRSPVPDGRLVPDLTQDAFAIDDNGKRQDITLFANTIQPITAVVLLDRSGSMRANFRLVEQAAEQFVDALLPGRQGAHRQLLEPDSDRSPRLHIRSRRAAHDSQSELQPEGPTPLWNAIYVGITALLHQQGRRVILVFTDGMDSPAAAARAIR